MSFIQKNIIKAKAYKYWDELSAQSNPALKRLVDAKPNSMYGENQDFVSTTVMALMPTIGYVRAETISVYFRSYKAQCRAVKAKVAATLGGHNA